jgi:hypothetical protein
MQTSSISSAALLLFLALTGIATAESKNVESLHKEQSSLEKTTDPVDRTRISVKVSDILIELLNDAAKSGKDSLVDQYLSEYSKTIKDAEDTLMKTGKDAHKHPSGFKELEIGLRKQQRRLSDISKLLDYDQRNALDRAQKLASDIDDHLVRVMLIKDPNAPRKP